MSMRSALREFQEKNKKRHVLVRWEEQDDDQSVSVVPAVKLAVGGVLDSSIGHMCTILVNRKKYKARIAAIGTEEEMKKLERDFIDGLYSPFDDNPSPQSPPCPPPPPPSSSKKRSLPDTSSQKSSPAPKKRKSGKENDSGSVNKFQGKKKSDQVILAVTEHGGESHQRDKARSVSPLLFSPPPSPLPPLSTHQEDSSVSRPMSPPPPAGFSPSPDCPLPSPSPPPLPPRLQPRLPPPCRSTALPAVQFQLGNQKTAAQYNVDLECRVASLESMVKDMHQMQQHLLHQLAQMNAVLLQPSPSPHARTPTTPDFNYTFESTDPVDVVDEGHIAAPDGRRSEQQPLPFSLRHTYKSPPLPSSEIQKSALEPIDDVLQSLLGGKGEIVDEEKAGTIAQKLAREAIFGFDIMQRCTPAGSKELPALPKAELFKLKTTIFHLLPKYWRKPEAFEVIWKEKCWVAVEQACRRFRKRNK